MSKTPSLLVALTCVALLSAAWLHLRTPLPEATPGSPQGQQGQPQAQMPAERADEAEQRLAQRLGQLEEQLQTLQAALREEQNSTLALQGELHRLQEQLDRQPAGEQVMQPADADSPAAAGAAVPRSLQGDAALAGSAGLSQEAALMAAGVDAETATALRSRLDQYALAELEIRDQAAREGWLDSADYRQRRDALLPPRVDIRGELGEQVWDNYLLASGRNNRVRVASVIEGSAAAIAGVEPGDLILAYAGERIFSIRELQRATRAGERGESVSVRLARTSAQTGAAGDTSAELIDTTIARGPLGVTLAAEQAAIPTDTVQ